MNRHEDSVSGCDLVKTIPFPDVPKVPVFTQILDVLNTLIEDGVLEPLGMVDCHEEPLDALENAFQGIIGGESLLWNERRVILLVEGNRRAEKR